MLKMNLMFLCCLHNKLCNMIGLLVIMLLELIFPIIISKDILHNTSKNNILFCIRVIYAFPAFLSTKSSQYTHSDFYISKKWEGLK